MMRSQHRHVIYEYYKKLFSKKVVKTCWWSL